MARVRQYKSYKYDLSNVISVDQLKSIKPIDPNKYKPMCAVVGEDGEPWIEAFQFLIHKSHLSHKTIKSNAEDLAHFLTFLEQEGINWLHFPTRKSDRCLYRYHEYLVDESRVSTSRATESRRMRLIVSFYRWAKHWGFVDKAIETWTDKNMSVAFYTPEGFQRSMPVLTTDLRIAKTKRDSDTDKVEDGLMPLHLSNRDALIQYLRESQSTVDQMLLHMFSLGFVSGARSETIRTLGVSDLQKAKDAHPLNENHPNYVYLKVGSGTNVKTKYGVSGHLRISKPVFDALYAYAFSPVRLKRAAKAKEKGNDSNIIFLSQKGNPITPNSFTGLMSNLRERLVADGLTQFRNLKFHQSRATCGTALAMAILKTGTGKDAVKIVKEWLMHKHESTTWKYIKFLEESTWTKDFTEDMDEYFLGPVFTSGAVSYD
jgi:site-specific recombinase XerD